MIQLLFYILLFLAVVGGFIILVAAVILGASWPKKEQTLQQPDEDRKRGEDYLRSAP